MRNAVHRATQNGIYGGTVVMGAQVTYAWGCGMYNKHRVFRRDCSLAATRCRARADSCAVN